MAFVRWDHHLSERGQFYFAFCNNQFQSQSIPISRQVCFWLNKSTAVRRINITTTYNISQKKQTSEFWEISIQMDKKYLYPNERGIQCDYLGYSCTFGRLLKPVATDFGPNWPIYWVLFLVKNDFWTTFEPRHWATLYSNLLVTLVTYVITLPMLLIPLVYVNSWYGCSVHMW